MPKAGLWLIFITMIVFTLVACKSQDISNRTDWVVEPFSVVNQDEQALALGDLKGKVWVANFIFTNCEDVCLPMTSNMSQLQTALKEKKVEDVQLISFSIDPTVDSPAVLKAFGDSFKADYHNWSFVTGYDQAYIEQFAQNNFKTLVKKPETGDQVIHGTAFYLIDEKGIVVQSYNGLDDFPLDEIIKHINILQNE